MPEKCLFLRFTSAFLGGARQDERARSLEDHCGICRIACRWASCCGNHAVDPACGAIFNFRCASCRTLPPSRGPTTASTGDLLASTMRPSKWRTSWSLAITGVIGWFSPLLSGIPLKLGRSPLATAILFGDGQSGSKNVRSGKHRQSLAVSAVTHSKKKGYGD